MKKEFGKPPKVHRDSDDEDHYWVGYKFTESGFRQEHPLAREMTKSAAQLLADQVAAKFFA